jgi:hypothetical protein
VFSYINFLLNQGRQGDALAIAHAAVMVDPKNGTFRDLEKNVAASIQSQAEASRTHQLAIASERLKELQILKVQKEAEYNQQKALYEKLKSLSPLDLRKALPIAYTDTYFNELLSEYDLAQQSLTKLKIDYSPDHPKYRIAQQSVDDLDRKINDRIEGVMIGLAARVDFAREYMETVKRDVEDARKAAEPAQ